MTRLFISHAHADQALIGPFVDLLQTGADVRQQDVFCTSLEGMGIPTGSNFADFIRKEFKASDFVVMIITPAYYESSFCLCELGATWITGSNAMPFLVPPLEYKDLKAVLGGTQAAFINDKNKLSELRDRLVQAGIASGATSRWEMKRDTFINLFKKIQGKLPGRTFVAASEYEGIQAQYEQAQAEIVERLEEIDSLKTVIEELKACKNRDEVAAVLTASMNEAEIFNQLIADVRPDVYKLPTVVVETLFHYFRDENYRPETGWGSEGTWDSINSSVQSGMLKINGGTVELDDDSPKISRVVEKLSRLKTFMDQASSEFTDHMTDTLDFQFSLKIREFWKQHFKNNW